MNLKSLKIQKQNNVEYNSIVAKLVCYGAVFLFLFKRDHKRMLRVV